jgi:hypothetical protein
MECTNLTDDQLWDAIAQNTEAISALIRQQLQLDAAAGPIHPRLKADLIRLASTFRREYQQYKAELRRRHPLA